MSLTIQNGTNDSHQFSKEEEKEVKVLVGRYGARHTQILLLFVMLMIGYSTRVNLSVGIRAMTDPHASTNPDIPTYNWQNSSTILSSFFWGYVVLQILAGSLVKKYGAKWFLAAAMGTNCLACLLTPVVAEAFGSTGVIVCRVLQGLFQGFFFPSAHTLLGKWVPPNERSILGSFTYGGPPLGTVLGMSLTGAISASWVGWPVAFYLFGGLGLAWMCIWCFLACNSPAEHPTISENERYYIETSLDTKESTDELKIPWKQIVTSLPMWAILIAHFGQNWGFATLLTQIPTYLNKVIGYPMEQNGFLSSAPYIAQFLTSLTSGPISDLLINKKILSRGMARKFFNSIGTLLPALSLVLLGFVPKENVSTSITLLIIAVGVNGAVSAGFQVNHVDLSPNYSGVLMGITNGLAAITALLGPLSVQAIVPDAKQENQSLWRIVFIISAVIYVVTNIFYVIFGSGKVQSWNDYGSKEKNTPNEMKNIEENSLEKNITKI